MRKISSKFVRACRENFSTWNVLHSKNYDFDPKTLFLFFLDTRSKNPKQPTSTDTASANTENTETTRFPTDKNKLSQARKICSNLLRKLLYMEWISKKIAKTCQKLLYMEWLRSKKCQKCDQSCASNMLIGSAQHAKHFALKLPLLCACIYAQEHTSY